jgi:hypothetical protein
MKLYLIGCILLLFVSLITCRELKEVVDFLSHTRNSLAESTWPLDHGDTARSKMSLNAGLPIGTKTEDLEVSVNSNLSLVQWVYSAGKNSEWIFLIRGDALNGFYVSKLK